MVVAYLALCTLNVLQHSNYNYVGPFICLLCCHFAFKKGSARAETSGQLLSFLHLAM